MPRRSSRFDWRDWLPLALGLALALAGLELARTRLVVKLEEAALGEDTKFVFDGEAAGRTLCQDARDSGLCRQAYETAQRPPAVLWLGNSQLPAINRLQPGDVPAPPLLHQALKVRGHYLVTYAQPNANLIEHSLAFGALVQQYDTRLLILPVFLDDIREQGIREGVAEWLVDPVVRKQVERSPVWTYVAPSLGRGGGADSETASAEVPSLQHRFETALNERLETWWPLWRARVNLRGLMAFSVHHLRNTVLGINAQTKRKVDVNVYKEKMAALTALLGYARERQVKVLLYIPPFRQDIAGPYVDADYTKLKTDLQALAAANGAHYANLEGIVPGPEWGLVVDPVYGFADYDFMHFTAEGHRRHAAALDSVLRQMGF